MSLFTILIKDNIVGWDAHITRDFGIPNTSLSLRFKSDLLLIPRMGMQDGKIEIPQTLLQLNPSETILENITFSSFGFIFSK